MSLHDFTHGPYDGYYSNNCELYISDSEDEYYGDNYHRLHKNCKSYNFNYNEAVGCYEDLADFYIIIEKLENRLNIEKSKRWKERVYQDSDFNFTYHSIDEDTLRSEFNTTAEAADYISDLDFKMCKIADDITDVRRATLEYMRKLAAQINETFRNKKELRAFIAKYK